MLERVATRVIVEYRQYKLVLFLATLLFLRISLFIDHFGLNTIAISVVNSSINQTSTSYHVFRFRDFSSNDMVIREHYLLGVFAYNQHQFDKAITWLIHSKSSPQRNRLASHYLASLYEKTENLELAAEEWKNAGESNWRFDYYLHLARLSFETNDYIVGDQLTKLSALLKPESAKPYWLIASVYRTKDNNKMLKALHDGLNRDSCSAWSYVARGLIAEYGTEHNTELASDCYQKALSIDPQHTYARLRLQDLISRNNNLPLLGPEDCQDTILQEK